MVARTPPKQRKMVVAPLNPILLRETVNKVDQCMARLQELQYTVTGGTKVIAGVSLSPRSTRVYLRTSLRCKQESLRIKSSNQRKSPPGKLPPVNGGEWRRMSLPAMLLGETVGEIIHASQFAREIVDKASSKTKNPLSDDPKTPATMKQRQRQNAENSELRSRRKREKQTGRQSTRTEPSSPSLQRARSRINFKPLQREIEKENRSYLANRVSPRNKPWAKKTVLFPNPLFNSSSPTSNHQKFNKTKSPIIPKSRQTPHKFLIKPKSPPPKPTSSVPKFQVKIKNPHVSVSPPKRPASSSRPSSFSKMSPKVTSAAAKLRRSFSPSRLANRLASPLKSKRLSVQSSEVVMSGLKQRPIPRRFSDFRI